MFRYPELEYLGRFTRLKRAIKCGGRRLTLFGINLEIILPTEFFSQGVYFFVWYIYKCQV
jgi:hypothetical protein